MPRSPHAANHPPISYPRAYDASTVSFSSSSASTSSSSTARNRKHSLTLSNPMGWLSRSSTQSSMSSSKTKRGSGSKSPKSIELVSERTGPIGLGATVVRTPEEALQDTRVCLTRYDTKGADELGQKPQIQYTSHIPSPISATISLPFSSPSLSPTPGEQEPSDVDDADVDTQESGDHDRCDDEEVIEQDEPFADGPSSPPRPSRACPPVPHDPPRPSLKSSPYCSTEDVSEIPPLPANIIPSVLQPEFQAILLSDVPTGQVDFSKTVITLETCTQTYRTTMDTLTSRPSHLSAYLISLFPRKRSDSNASSVYSTSSDDMSMYRNHLASQGLISSQKLPTNLHIFLDRPSAPYAHVLNYLRTPVPASGLPEILPRAVQLQPSYTQTRLEALLELRDEAAYLELDGLYKLCNEEIKLRQHASPPRLHSRNQSRTIQSSTVPGRTSVQSHHAVIQSFPNELSTSDTESRRPKLVPKSPGSFTQRPHATTGSIDSTARVRSPPTPQSWMTDARSSAASGASSTRSRSIPRTGVMNNPPAGWI
ncbi:hypothetical protein AAF712_001929 [Marasmius tenuissimus]|uniref:Uncharacterized protein n=1 Tax=Marasmius tenuissimus TaxID=585030 RepID=A0ABR3AAK0_9AGAR